jgi:hypothetical protein
MEGQDIDPGKIILKSYGEGYSKSLKLFVVCAENNICANKPPYIIEPPRM